MSVLLLNSIALEPVGRCLCFDGGGEERPDDTGHR